MKITKEVKNQAVVSAASPKARINSNLNSPRNKIPTSQKNQGLPKSPSTITNKNIVQNQKFTKRIESDASTQDPVAKSISTLKSPTKKQMYTPGSVLQQKVFPKPDYSKVQSKIGSPRNYFHSKPNSKKVEEQKSAVSIICPCCQQLKLKQIELMNRICQVEKKYSEECENKSKQVSELEEKKMEMEKKLAMFDSIMTQNKKLVKEKVNSFNNQGNKKQLMDRINELQEEVVKLQADKKQLESRFNPEHENKFPNLISTKSEMMPQQSIYVSELVEMPQNLLGSVSKNKGRSGSHFNESQIYRMVESKIDTVLSSEVENKEEKANILAKIKRQYDECLGEISYQFGDKIKDLEDEVNKKYEEIISLKEQIISNKSDKEQFERKLRQQEIQAKNIRTQNSILRMKITDYQRDIKFNKSSESTLHSQVDISQHKDNKNLLKQLCSRRRTNNRNCLSKLDQIKAISDQQCEIIQQMKASSKIEFLNFEDLSN